MLKKLTNKSTYGKVLILTAIFTMLFNVYAFASTTGGNASKTSNTTSSGNTSKNNDSSSSTGILQSQSADAVASQAMSAIKPILVAFGAVCVFAGVAMIGFKLIFAHNNPDKRISAMSGLLYIGIGAFIVGGCSLVAGFFWGLGA